MLLPSATEHCTFQKAVVSSGFSCFIRANVLSWLENSSRLHCSQEALFNSPAWEQLGRQEEQLTVATR